MDIVDFYTKGVTRLEVDFNFDSLESISDFNEIKKEESTSIKDLENHNFNGLSDDAKEILTELSNLIENVLQKPAKVVFLDMWEGTRPDTEEWHSDYVKLVDKSIHAVNLYMDDSDENTGGRIDFRLLGNEDIDFGIYPKKHDLLLFNHGPYWEHRVTPSTKKRRLLIFRVIFENESF